MLYSAIRFLGIVPTNALEALLCSFSLSIYTDSEESVNEPLGALLCVVTLLSYCVFTLHLLYRYGDDRMGESVSRYR